MVLTRRGLLIGGAGVILGSRVMRASAGQGLDQFSAAGVACNDTGKTTPAVPRDATFKAGSPARSSLLVGGATPGLTLTGTVSGVTCGPIKGARVDFWHADAAGVYDMQGYNFRGHQLTDATGGYRLSTLVPGASSGRARHIGVNVNVPGKADFWTEVFFPDDQGRAKDLRFNKDLVIRLLPGNNAARRTGTFDFVLNL